MNKKAIILYVISNSWASAKIETDGIKNVDWKMRFNYFRNRALYTNDPINVCNVLFRINAAGLVLHAEKIRTFLTIHARHARQDSHRTSIKTIASN